MHEFLEAACDVLDLELPALERAAAFSQEQVQEARRFFRDRIGLDHGLDIVVCGSLGRREMSAASDFDYLVVAHGLVEDVTRFRSARLACDEWCTRRSLPSPGTTGLFGRVVSATELVEQIGLEFDTNASLTRRLLLLEEGVSVLQPEKHQQFVNVMLGRYLLEEDAGGPPWFLLNDVTRYWRTIAVDYQAKVWRDLSDDGWGLRWLKLRISRKLTFVSAVVSALLVALEAPDDRRAFLCEQFVDVPALARVAQLTRVLDGDEQALGDLRDVLSIADRFAAYLQDKEQRAAARRVRPPVGAVVEPGFVEMREASDALQACLERLFFDAPALRDLSRRYLTF